MKKLLGAILLLTAGTSWSQNDIYVEDFESGLPINYTIVDNDGLTPEASVSEFSDAWILLDDPDNPGDSIMGSTSYFDPAGTASRWLITPAITLGATGNYLYWEAKSHDASFPDAYDIYISTTDTQLSSFTDTVYRIFEEQATWQQRSVGLSAAGFNSTTIYIAFVNRTEDGFKLYIDDIRVEENNPLSVEENEIAKAVVAPNPASSVVNVTNVDVRELMVYSLDGRLLLNTTNSSIDISSLQTGKYLLKIDSEQGQTVKSIEKI